MYAAIFSAEIIYARGLPTTGDPILFLVRTLLAFQVIFAR